MGSSCIAAALRWLFVITTYSDAILRGPESNRKNSLRSLAMNDGSFRDCPVDPAIGGVEYTRGWSAGGKPDVVFSESRDAGAAGGESAFFGQGVWHFLHEDRIPINAVAGGNQGELAIHGVAHGNAVGAVPEGKAIIKSIGIVVCELALPDASAISGLIDAGFVAFANAEYVGGVFVKSADITKIKVLGANNFKFLPSCAAIHRA